MSKLATVQQREFAHLVVDGVGKSEAYRQVYRSKMSAKNVSAKAAHLAAKPTVKALIEKLQARFDEKRHAKRTEKRGILADVMRDESKRPLERIKAIEVDNVMTGDNAPQQVNVFGLGELLNLVRKGNRG